MLLLASGDAALAVPIIAIIFTFLFLMLKTIMAPFTARASRDASAGLSEEEQAILEKLQRTLGQMEERVEALEIILIEQSRSKEKV